MKSLLFLLSALLLSVTCFSQDKPYWQQQVNYDIDVTFDDTEHFLDGFVKMEYFNNSPDTLRYIWIHLWQNAYKNDRTAFTDQDLENGNTDFYFSDTKDKGYINRMGFTVNDVVATTEDHQQHQDIVKLLLPQPLAPGKKILIETPFHIKLSGIFSRSGHKEQTYQVTQWFPKAAVYDKKGWHEMPYLDLGEFYSNFGDYQVQITLPSEYKVAATGVQVAKSDSNQLTTLKFRQSNVHDFAWFASKDFIIAHDTLQLASKVINIYTYHSTKNAEDWTNAMYFTKRAVITKSEWLGEYPYDVISVVEGTGFGDGMEYPTIALAGNAGNENLLDYVINHEVGHNWFYGILATNERLHPWMDEGMNSYYDKRYNKLYYNREGIIINTGNNFIDNRMPADPEQMLLNTITAIKRDQPIETPSEQFSMINYGLIAYSKAAQWMQLLERETGTANFDQIMKTYYDRWKFRHPYPEDFKLVAEEIYGQSLDSVFSLLYKKGSLTPPAKKQTKVASFFSFKDTDQYSYLFITPTIGYNTYDKLMIGAGVHNYTLPLSPFRFYIAPMYATGSKKFNGIAGASYNVYLDNGSKLSVGLSAAKFSMDSFTDSANVTTYLGFSKLVPNIKYTFANKNARSTRIHSIQFKSFLLNEQGYLFTRDTINQNYIITFPKEAISVHQLNFVISDQRKLYPYALSLQGENGKGFIKTGITGNYFFNYSKGGGAQVRLFAGKFFYTGDKQTDYFKTYRYHFNLTGANGYEDYTYSNYFIGRNEFEGLMSQQIMIKDGGFKVRSDLLSNKYGRSDDWLAAINFSTTIPKKIFPLPIKLFADVGTYAEAWDDEPMTGKFLYDAGIQISVLKFINIYLPVLYSKEYKEYFKSYIPEKRFRQSISFSIDVQNLNLKTYFPQSPF